MNPLFLALGAGALVYAVARSSKASSSSAQRAPITYQMARAEDWASPGGVPKPTPPNEFIIVGNNPRGLFHARIRATKLPDGFYVIDEVIYNKTPGALDIIPGYDHGWLWTPKKDASGNIILDDKGQEVWVESL